MADPFTGEIRAFGFNFAPVNWAYCNGQQITIQQNTALYALLGTTYGGNASSYFNLPDLQGRTAVDAGAGKSLTARNLGQTLGEAAVALTSASLPAHAHALTAESTTTAAQVQATPSPQSFLTRCPGQPIYSDVAGTPAMLNGSTLGPAGQSKAHENRQPYLAVNFCICLYGEWPPHP